MATCLIAVGGSISWDAVGAVATAFATIVALGASVLAVRMPDIQKMRMRSEATAEILSATVEALQIFEEARNAFEKATWKDDKCAGIAARAEHTRLALDRLLNRSELTDGAIVTGSGAMRLMDAVQAARDVVFEPNGVNFNLRSSMELLIVDCMVPIVEERADRVARYACERKWPKWQTKFAIYMKDGVSARRRLPPFEAELLGLSAGARRPISNI